MRTTGQGAGPGKGREGGSHPASPRAILPSALVQAVIASFIEDGGLSARSLAVFTDLWRRFAAFCERGLGVVDARQIEARHVEAFMGAPHPERGFPTDATKHLRHGAVRLLFRRGRRLGLVSGDPTIDVPVPPRSPRSTVPLNDAQIERCRLHAVDTLTDLRLPVIWALAETGARPSEIPPIRVSHVDLGRGLVFVPGGPRTDARWAPLTGWGAAQLGRRLAAPGLDPESPLVPWRLRRMNRPGGAATMAIIQVLRAAGIHGQPGVRPASVTAWAGARLLEEGYSIDQVARALGCKTLDTAAEIAGFDWRAGP